MPTFKQTQVLSGIVDQLRNQSMDENMKSVRMPFRKSAVVSAMSVAFLGATGAVSVFAQTETDVQLQTVHVTAQGRKENPLKIPYNITALGGEDLEERRIVDQNELLREVSGASVVDRGYRNSGVVSGVTLRGMNVNGAALGDYQTSAVPTVSTYVNQTPLFANFLIKDVERVEVLRGPQGTLYGSGSLGGTLRYITRAPELKVTGGRVESAVASVDGSGGLEKSLDVVVNVPIADTAALRISAGTVRNAGVVDYKNVYQLDASGVPVAPLGVANNAAAYRTVEDADTVAIDYARLSLLYKPNSKFQATLTHQEQTDDIGGRRQPTRGSDGYGVAYDKYENGSIQLEPSSRKAELNSLEMEFDLGFGTLTSATSFTEQNGHSLSENTGYYAKNNWLRNFYYNPARPMAQADRSYADKSTSQELRLVSKTGGAFDYIAGAYYMDQDLRATQKSYLKGIQSVYDFFTNENDFDYSRVQTYRDLSVYGELTYHVSPKLRATVGMRHFDTQLDNTSSMGFPIWGNLFPTQTTSFNQDATGNLFKANLAYDLSKQQMVYGTISEGFRHGGSNAVPTVGNFAESANYQSYKPDTNINYEIGIKGTTGRTRYSVSAYQIDWKDIQLEVATPTWGFFAAQNGGKASSKGLEVELAGPITDSLSYKVSYSYNDAKLTEAVYRASNGTTLIAPVGTRLPGTAMNTFNASLEHSSSVSDKWTWTNRINVFAQGETENSIEQSVKVKQTLPGFSIWGVSSSLSSDRWSLSLFVKNLLNQEAITGSFLEANMGTDPTQNYFGNGSKVFISQPRTIGMSASYKF
jgi:iron complex outermembrane recepter protein